jgi:hypothetical protein
MKDEGGITLTGQNETGHPKEVRAPGFVPPRTAVKFDARHKNQAELNTVNKQIWGQPTISLKCPPLASFAGA